MNIFIAIALLCANPAKPEAQLDCQKFYVRCMGDFLNSADTWEIRQNKRLSDCTLAFKSFK